MEKNPPGSLQLAGGGEGGWMDGSNPGLSHRTFGVRVQHDVKS